MTDKKITVVNPKTGLREYKQYEEYRPKGQIANGVDKMRSHFEAASSLEQKQLALVAREQEQIAAKKAQDEAIRITRLQAEEERKAAQRQTDRDFQEKQQKKERDDLALAMKENREKFMRNTAGL